MYQEKGTQFIFEISPLAIVEFAVDVTGEHTQVMRLVWLWFQESLHIW